MSVAPKDAIPGDAVFAETHDLFGRVIHFGEWLKRPWRKGSKFTHMAMIVESDPGGNPWVMQMGRHCERVRLSDVAPGGTVEIRSCPPEVDREKAVEYAETLEGIGYAVSVIVSIAFNLWTPSFVSIDFRRTRGRYGTLICSAFVARCWEHGGYNLPYSDPFQVTPAQMAEVVA